MNYDLTKDNLMRAKELLRVVKEDLDDAAHKNHTNYEEGKKLELESLLQTVENLASTSSMWWGQLERTSPASEYYCFRLKGDPESVKEKI